MAKSPPGSRPDPMVREVDRLLARLDQLGRPPEPAASRNGAHPDRPVTPRRSSAVVLSASTPSRGDLVALWARVLLGLVFGAAMTQWPYHHRCDLPLAGYLAAVLAVLLTAAWIAFASWKLRSGPAHVVALVLFYWGIVLAAEQLLPRIGYAADAASWRCPRALSVSGGPDRRSHPADQSGASVAAILRA